MSESGGECLSYLLLFPYLPIRRVLEFGPFTLQPWSADLVPEGWQRSAALRVVAAHLDRDGTAVKNPALLTLPVPWDGRLPDSDEWAAGRAALTFSALHSNSEWRNETDLRRIAREEATRRHDEDPTADQIERQFRHLELEQRQSLSNAMQVVTTDNVEHFWWPLGHDGQIAMEYGTIVTTLVGGSDVKVRPPNELSIPLEVRIEPLLLAELYRALVVDSEAARDLQLVIELLGAAFTNSPRVAPRTRLVELRAAFEVLLASESEQLSKERLAERLRNLFESIPDDEQQVLRPSQMLWSPGEAEDRSHPLPGRRPGRQGRRDRFTPLEHWFISFSDARNKGAHRGETVIEYKDSQSVYEGPYWRIASRVLREAILVRATELGAPPLWVSPAALGMRKTLDRLTHDDS